jgi:uncharacterized protein YacL
MGRKIARFFIILVGLFIGPGISVLVLELLHNFELGLPPNEEWLRLIIYITSGVVSGVIFIFLSKPIVHLIFRSARSADKRIEKIPGNVVLPAVIGLILGLVVAFLLSSLVNNIITGGISWLASIINVIIYIVCVYLGISTFVRHKASVFDVFKRHKDAEKGSELSGAKPKLLDTSVIIDGRIFDICNTGIIEGALIIPEFVLDELRHIADSSDDLKRNRGRRGLDVLQRIQSELKVPVKIVHSETDETAEVDSRLLSLAKDMNGIVVTNDYNLNKVAALKNVQVLNINELANALKPVVLPGEEMKVTIVKDGKEPGQGIAYLDDGTMIVVEGGKNEQGKPLSVIVTSVLQTSAGRMIFAKIR